MKIDDIMKLKRGDCIKSNRTGDTAIVKTVGKKRDIFFILFVDKLNGNSSYYFSPGSNNKYFEKIDDLELVKGN